MAIVSMVLGIVGVLISCCIWYIAIPLGIAGIILGILVLRNKKPGKAMAIVGIVLSSITILFGLITMIFYIIFSTNQVLFEEFFESIFGDEFRDILDEIEN